LPVEFARESSGERITLVLVEGARLVRTLWALMSSANLDEARNALREREGISEGHLDRDIGFWCADRDSGGLAVEEIQTWTQRLQLDAAVWTALPPGFKNRRGQTPTPEKIVEFLRGRDAEARRNAEEYVRRAPRQIDTDVRRMLEFELGWTPSPKDYVR